MEFFLQISTLFSVGFHFYISLPEIKKSNGRIFPLFSFVTNTFDGRIEESNLKLIYVEKALTSNKGKNHEEIHFENDSFLNLFVVCVYVCMCMSAYKVDDNFYKYG